MRSGMNRSHGTMLVVKLGGSLAASPELPRWVDMIAAAGAGKVVLVPGGGPWADAVRAAQAREGFDDCTAHRRALLAMEQYGRVLVEMNARLVAAQNESTIRKALSQASVPVWMPCEMAVAEASIPESWDVTSDSLAAWLAALLGASRLLLVKSLPSIARQPAAEEMAALGWVDAAFPRYACASFEVHLLGASDLRLAGRLLAAA